MRNVILLAVITLTLAATLPAQIPFLAPVSYVGLGIADINADRAESIGLIEPHGVEVMNVAKDSPAMRAGLETGDVLLTYRGTRIEGIEHFARMVKETPVGRNVSLGIHRSGTARTVDVTIGERESLISRVGTTPVIPRPPSVRFSRQSIDMPRPRMVVQSGSLGAELEAIDGQFASFFGVSSGVLVRSVQSNSAAETADLEAGDVIVSVDGEPVTQTREVSHAVQTSRTGKVSIEVIRGGAKQTVEVTQAARGARPGMTRRVNAPR